VILFNFFEDSDVSQKLWRLLFDVPQESQVVASDEDRALARINTQALRDPQLAPLATEVCFCFCFETIDKPNDQHSSNSFTSP
jgi:hypothetical protein